jgi:hypothetical protein
VFVIWIGNLLCNVRDDCGENGEGNVSVERAMYDGVCCSRSLLTGFNLLCCFARGVSCCVCLFVWRVVHLFIVLLRTFFFVVCLFVCGQGPTAGLGQHMLAGGLTGTVYWMVQ